MPCRAGQMLKTHSSHLNWDALGWRGPCAILAQTGFVPGGMHAAQEERRERLCWASPPQPSSQLPVQARVLPQPPGAPPSACSPRRGSKRRSEPLHQRLRRSSRGQSDLHRPPEPSAAWGHEPSRLCPSHLCRGRLQTPLSWERGRPALLVMPAMPVAAWGGLAARQRRRCRLLLPGERPRAGPLPARAHSEGGTAGEPPKILMNS